MFTKLTLDKSSLRPYRKRICAKTARRFCCYKGCSSDRLITRDGAISFFCYPIKDTERCSLWITRSGREEFRYLTPRELQEKRICELHFSRGMFSNDFKTNLIRNAVPDDYTTFSEDPIQIDDDEEINLSDEGESGVPVVSETSRDNVTSEKHNQIRNEVVNGSSSPRNNVNGDILCVELNDEEDNSSVCTGRETKSQSTQSVGSQLPVSNKNSVANEENDFQKEDHHEVPQQKQSIVKNQTALKETTKVDNKTEPNKDNHKNLERRNTNTKFHNLPPQTTQSDFYFQQCPVAEETNSFSEPPDGELPLFVQQDSVSVADEQANSETSEPPSKKRKKDKDNGDDLAEQMREAMKHLLNITSLLTNNDDEFELFGKSVALQLKKMSLCTALTVQAKIQQLLSQSRIHDIKKKSKEVLASDSDCEEIRTELKATSEGGKVRSTSPQPSVASVCSESDTAEVG